MFPGEFSEEQSQWRVSFCCSILERCDEIYFLVSIFDSCVFWHDNARRWMTCGRLGAFMLRRVYWLIAGGLPSIRKSGVGLERVKGKVFGIWKTSLLVSVLLMLH